MPLLGAVDPLPVRPSRVLVAGTSGAGKTTLARAVASRLDLPHTELDALFHGPDWSVVPTFADDVRALAAGERWVTEWQYDDARPILLARCDLLVALDLPRRVVMTRLTRRTVRRSVRRERLWAGNVEAPLRTVLTERNHILRWAWRTHGHLAGRVADAAAARQDLPVVVLRSPRDVRAWLSGPLAAVA